MAGRSGRSCCGRRRIRRGGSRSCGRRSCSWHHSISACGPASSCRSLRSVVAPVSAGYVQGCSFGRVRGRTSGRGGHLGRGFDFCHNQVIFYKSGPGAASRRTSAPRVRTASSNGNGSAFCLSTLHAHSQSQSSGLRYTMPRMHKVCAARHGTAHISTTTPCNVYMLRSHTYDP